jgi:hypothetical protein
MRAANWSASVRSRRGGGGSLHSGGGRGAARATSSKISILRVELRVSSQSSKVPWLSRGIPEALVRVRVRVRASVRVRVWVIEFEVLELLRVSNSYTLYTLYTIQDNTLH